MAANPLLKLREAGQSLWIDYLSREMIRSGKLKRLIDEDGLSGVTSNPTIFQKAIEGSDLYDDQLRDLIYRGVRDEKELFLELAMKDVADAADILHPVYRSSEGRDGFVSIEVSPDLAYDTDASIAEARRLFYRIDRENVMVKVPATKAGLPAIEQLTSEGVNVNVTLLFSVQRYAEVADAYLNGIERRLRRGESVQSIASVASFFVSRVDTLVDELLDARRASAGSEEEKQRFASLYGRAAVANARLAYRKFKEIISDSRFRELHRKGAPIQRLLWGSSSTKNPAYSDIKYVEELIGPDTVNTMPEETMTAFRDHGTVRITIDQDLDRAEALFAELAAFGIYKEDVADRLEQEGVKKFSDSFFDVVAKIAEKRDRFLVGAAA